MPPEYPWWVRLIALVSGKTPAQIAWQLRQREVDRDEGRDGSVDMPRMRPSRPAGPWWHSFVPEIGRQAPMTFALGMSCVIWYAFGVLGTDGDIAAFSGYTIQHFGATNGVLIHAGEWWRVLTSNLVHHDLMHLGFNLYALAIAGRLEEELYGSAKTMVAFVVTGVVAMTFSHVYNTYIMDIAAMTSGGASGSLCGFMGMALVGGHRLGTRQGILIRNGMAKWAGYLVLFGVLVPFVNNAAHGGGFVAGCALGAVLPYGKRSQSQVSILAAWAMAGLLIFAVSLQIQGWDKAPAGIRGLPRTIFGMTLESDPNLRLGQLPGFKKCLQWSPPRIPTEEDLRACVHLTKALPACRESWSYLQAQNRILGDTQGVEKAERALELELRTCFQ